MRGQIGKMRPNERNTNVYIGGIMTRLWKYPPLCTGNHTWITDNENTYCGICGVIQKGASMRLATWRGELVEVMPDGNVYTLHEGIHIGDVWTLEGVKYTAEVQ